MTRSSQIGPVLADFLAEGVTELADRVIEATLTDIDHTRQRRAHSVPWRYTDMPRSMRLILAGVVLAIAAGGGFVLAGTLRPPDPPPDMTPTPVPVDAGPAQLLGSDPAGSYRANRAGSFGLPAGDYELVIPPSPGTQIVLARAPEGREILLGTITSSESRATFSATDRCEQAGTYDWSLGEDNQSLELVLVDDACRDRAGLLAGSWARATMQYRLAPGRRYEISSNGTTFAFTIPAGFSSPATGGPQLTVELNVAGTGQHAVFADGEDLEFFLIAMQRPMVFSDRCDATKGRGDNGPRTLEQFIAWNRATSGSTISEPVAVTIAGKPGVSIDIVTTSGCANGEDEIAPYDGLTSGMTTRTWGVDLGGSLAIIGFVPTGPPWTALTDDQLAVASELVSSMTMD